MYIQFFYDQSGIELSNYYFENENHRFIGPIKNLNIFIGPNNSGKSRFIRGLLKLETIQYDKNKEFYINYLKFREDLVEFIDIYNIDTNTPFLNIRKNTDYYAIDKDLIEGLPKDRFSFDHTSEHCKYSNDFFKEIKVSADSLINIYERPDAVKKIKDILNEYNYKLLFLVKVLALSTSDSAGHHFLFNNLHSIDEVTKGYLQNLSSSFTNFLKTFDYHSENIGKIYLPILRTSYSLYEKDQNDNNKILESDIFSISAKTYYNFEHLKQLEVFTGMTLFKLVRDLSNSPLIFRKKLQDFETFLSKTFYENLNVEITAYRPNKNLDSYEYTKEALLMTVGDVERAIYNFGDGINNIIILMYRLFTCNDNSWIFIEEPEISLHPAYQRIFIETILTNQIIKRKNLKIFISTHSNHLLDITLEDFENVSLFIFEKTLDNSKERFKIESVNNSDIRILNFLGINNSSIFIANCSIWVEGITDRKYLKAYLKAYFKSQEFKNNKHYIEDIHYNFFEYAGSNIEHYIFNAENTEEESVDLKMHAKYLCNRIFLLADKDKGRDKKHMKLSEQTNLQFRYETTGGKEIENLISSDLLKIILPSFNKISKEDIEKVNFNESEYIEIGIGKYLQDQLNIEDLKFTESLSGTLTNYYKERFADLVSENVTWGNMSEGAKELTKKVYEFIQEHNK